MSMKEITIAVIAMFFPAFLFAAYDVREKKAEKTADQSLQSVIQKKETAVKAETADVNYVA